jgi:hypothetical protein
MSSSDQALCEHTAWAGRKTQLLVSLCFTTIRHQTTIISVPPNLVGLRHLHGQLFINS